MKAHYDLLVIGSGPAGQKAAISMAKRGHSCLIIEKRPHVGGGCLHTGTIPSKTLREAAVTNRRRKRFFTASDENELMAYKDVSHHLHNVIHGELDVVHNQLTRNNIDYTIGTASFVNPHTLRVVDDNGDSSKFTGDFILIATGSSPNRPDYVPFDDDVICDSDSILNMTTIPKSMIIMGAGVIGSEYACIFSKMGVKVHLINKYKDILNFVDVDIRRNLMTEMKNSGIQMYSEVTADKVEITGDRKVCVTLSNGLEIEAQKLLWSMGRDGNSDGLNLEAVGLAAQKYKLIHVNEAFQTDVDHIYACGDVIGYPSLASVSAEQGRLAAYHMMGMKVHRLDSDRFPIGIYTIPEISFVGRTEAQLSEQEIPFVTGVSDFSEVARGHIQGQAQGMLKMHFHAETYKLLGVHIISNGASELVHIGQTVLSFNGDLTYFIDTVFNYPTLAEAYKVAALNAMNKLPPSCSLFQ